MGWLHPHYANNTHLFCSAPLTVFLAPTAVKTLPSPLKTKLVNCSKLCLAFIQFQGVCHTEQGQYRGSTEGGGANWTGSSASPVLVKPQSYRITCSTAIRWAYRAPQRNKPNGNMAITSQKQSRLRTKYWIGPMANFWLLFIIYGVMEENFWIERCLNDKPHTQRWRHQAAKKSCNGERNIFHFIQEGEKKISPIKKWVLQKKGNSNKLPDTCLASVDMP